MTKGIIGRFNSFVVKRSDKSCWAWDGNKSKQGYGKISIFGDAHLAHRISYELFKGPIPESMMVCHSCDNPECTNPEHLFLGTAQTNMSDKISKGRHKGAKRGGDHHLSKLSEFDVKRIRRIYAQGGVTQYQLADQFNVSQPEISMIVTFKKWGHVA